MFLPSAFLLLATFCCEVLRSYSSGCETFKSMSRSVLSCQLQGLSTVPPIPSDVEIVLLNFNHISSISHNSFPKLPRLQSLLLGGQSKNGSLYIGQDAFQNLPNLSFLDLGGNGNLSLHPEAFKGLFKLEVLFLDNNRLDESVLESGLFTDLLSLRKLDLSYNKIRRFRPDQSFLRLSFLSTIVLKLNHISRLCGNDLENLKGRRLELLDLSSNPLQVSNVSLCPNPFVNLTLNTLDISRIGWKAEKFQYFFKSISSTQVKHIKMQYGTLGSGFGFNNLKNPDENTFAGLNSSNVYGLDMSHSYISQLAPDVFSAFSKLLSLDLSSSKINIISRGAFSGLKELVSLNMSVNLIGDIPVSSLESLWSSPLKALDLGSNNIGAIQFGAMNGLTSLETLSLKDNALSDIPPVQLPALTVVLLKQNRIANTYGLTSFCPNCTFLDLSSNRLTDLRSLWNILQLRSLKVLLLNSNKFSNCSPKNSKPKDKSKLLYLDLSDNDLGQIWKSGQCGDILSNLKSLEMLSLSKNHIDTLPKDVLQGLQNLQTLDLSRNNLRLLHEEEFTDLISLKTLKIGSNNLVTLSPQTFKPLSSLQNVDLSHTKFVCNCGLTDLWSWMKTTNVTVEVSQNGQLTCLKLPSPIQEISLEDYSNHC